MTVERIVELLKEAGVQGYEITDTKTIGWEFYFIRHELDQNRVRDVRHTEINVFVPSEDGSLLGNAMGEISPTATDEEAKEMIKNLIFQAGLVQNPTYQLNEPADNPIEDYDFDVQEVAKDFLEAFQSVVETETEDLNSYEIFVNDVTKRFINSRGIDVTYRYPRAMIEVVVNARKEKHEIELYRLYQSGTCDKEGLIADINETLRYGKDKLVAQDTPLLKTYPVLFSTIDAREIYWYFIDRLNAAYVYQKYSNYELGKEIYENPEGDTLTIRGLRNLPNSFANFPYDMEGAPIHDTLLLEKNVPMHYWGSRKFSQYLGLEKSSYLHNFAIEGGSQTEEEIRKGDYLEVVEFSALGCDPVTGDIAGEIRLGYLHQNGEVKIVSGGSISGDLTELGRKMYLSKETRQYNTFVVPRVTLIKDMSITGVK